MFARSLVSALLALATLSAVPASAQPVNSSTTVQTGGGLNTSSTDQRGAVNDATTAQFGFDNLATMRQHGSLANGAKCGQDGAINDCRVIQRDRNGN